MVKLINFTVSQKIDKMNNQKEHWFAKQEDFAEQSLF